MVRLKKGYVSVQLRSRFGINISLRRDNIVHRLLHQTSVKMSRIQSHEDPTSWNEHIYSAEDYGTRIWQEKPGNVLVLSGNNAEKFDHIQQAVSEGVHVYSDKPMIIGRKDYPALVSLLDEAKSNDLLVYDIMTERYEVTTRLQRILAMDSALTGGLLKGSAEMPTIEKHSVHYLSKVVSGKQLVRPEWFLDISQQGRPVADVGTHLADLILWTLNGENPINQSRIEVLEASEWPTYLTAIQYQKVTGKASFADFLSESINEDDILQLQINGRCSFKLDDYHARYSVEWGFEAKEGGDTHYSVIRGRNVNLEIRQGADEGFIPQLYIVNLDDGPKVAGRLEVLQGELQSEFPGVSFEYVEEVGWMANIPDSLRIGHEAHFAQVTKKYLQYLQEGVMPQWEIDLMKTKYFVTTGADQLAQKDN
jgi:hypothetical protein